MGKGPAKNIRIYLDRYDLSGFLNATTAKVDQQTPAATTFADTGPRVVVDNYDHSHSDLGLFDGVDDAIDEILQALVGDGGAHYLLKCFQGLTRGNVAYEYPVLLTSKPLSASAGGVVMLNLESQGAGGVARGVVLHDGAITAGNQPGVNQGATLAGDIYRVAFRLLSFTGTSITLKLQESQNDGSPDAYADIAGLTTTAMTTAGIQVVQTAAATEAWKRVVATGTFSAATAIVAAGIVVD